MIKYLPHFIIIKSSMWWKTGLWAEIRHKECLLLYRNKNEKNLYDRSIYVKIHLKKILILQSVWTLKIWSYIGSDNKMLIIVLWLWPCNYWCYLHQLWWVSMNISSRQVMSKTWHFESKPLCYLLRMKHFVFYLLLFFCFGLVLFFCFIYSLSQQLVQLYQIAEYWSSNLKLKFTYIWAEIST